jgi:predicted  nucleic acid-binding Zn-ribbon protein
MMDNQFVLLIELQRLDERLRTLHVEQQRLPQQLQPYEMACTAAQQALVRLQEDIALADRQRRALERELDSLQAHLAKTQSKLHDVKTNKEYSAVLTEIDTGKQRIAALEDQVLDLMERTEQYRQEYHDHEQRLQVARDELEHQGRRVQHDQEALAERIAVEETKRQQLVPNLEAQLYAMYQRLATLRHGQAVVYVQDGTCGGCYLKVQPQLVSEIRRQEKLIVCPHCQRMLLWPTE